MNERADLLDVRHYELTLDLTRSETSARVKTHVEFLWNGPTRTTFADLDAARMIGGNLNGRALEGGAHEHGRLHLTGLEPSNVLTVEAEVPFAEDGRGICQFIDPDDGGRYVYTKGMPFVAPRIMCCFQRANRAPLEIIVIAPPGWTCLSHTPASEQPPASEIGRWTFPKTAPLSPETILVAAGPFATSSTPPGVRTQIRPTLYGRQAVAEKLARSPAGQIAAECIHLESELLGVDYPFDGFDLLFAPNYTALGGSSPGVTTLHEFLLHESVDPQARRHVVWALAHEVAHAWFGSLVMDRRWDATWLTEGLATYMCYHAMEALTPDLHPWALFHILEEAEAHKADSEEDIHAVAAAAKADAALAPEPGETYVFRAPIVYAKPAALIRQLASVIGERAVFDGLRVFLTQHVFDEATTDDLIGCWSVAAGRDLTQWATDWLESPGVNTLELVINSKDGIVSEATVLQHAPACGGPLRAHQVDIAMFDVHDGTVVARPSLSLDVRGEETTIRELVGAPNADLMLLNAPPKTYAKVRLDDRARSTLSSCMSQLEPAMRATCWVAAIEMVADGLMSKEEYAGWVEIHGAVEADHGVRDLLASKVSG